MNTITSFPIVPPFPAIAGVKASPTQSSGGASFKDMLMNSLNEVNSMQQQANQAVEQMAMGEDVSTAEVLTAVQKADIAFRMMLQIRNKVVQAYQEVQNIRV
jgi:flagellar hook-basal body complex protein FliE